MARQNKTEYKIDRIQLALEELEKGNIENVKTFLAYQLSAAKLKLSKLRNKI